MPLEVTLIELTNLKNNAEKICEELKNSNNNIHKQSCHLLQSRIIDISIDNFKEYYEKNFNRITCPFCNNKMYFHQFDYIGLKEWALSNFCLKCQEDFFG